MRIIRSGTKYSIYDNGIETYEHLPIGTYVVGYDKSEGCFLIRRNDMTVTEKTYGVHNHKLQKVMDCDCPYSDLCKHEVAVAITLRMLFKQPQFKLAGDFMALDRWLFWQLASRAETIDI